MEPIIWMSLGGAGVVCLILMRLAARHGWAWVQAQFKQHAGGSSLRNGKRTGRFAAKNMRETKNRERVSIPQARNAL